MPIISAIQPNKGVRTDARLSAALDMLSPCRVIADIGCDHGRLSCALVQRDEEKRCIAADISLPSLEKTKRLARLIGVETRVEARLGDGLSVLQTGEADALAILGMGGTQIARILSAADVPLCGAKRAVLQPMRTAEDIRRWLFQNGYPIADDRIVPDGRRYYQVFCALIPQGAPDALPNGWPGDFHMLGYRAFLRREPLFPALAKYTLFQCERAAKSNRAPEMEQNCLALRQILTLWGDS